MHPVEIVGYEPDNILVEHEGGSSELALALAVRHCYEFELRRTLLGRFQGEPVTPRLLTDVAMQAVTLKSLYRDYLVYEPGKRLPHYKRIISELSFDLIEDARADHPELSDIENADALAALYTDLTKGETVRIEIAIHNRFVKTLAVSETLAQDLGVNRSVVFIHEPHYTELVRRALHPDDYFIPFELRDEFNSANYWKNLLIETVLRAARRDPQASPENLLALHNALERDSRLNDETKNFVLQQRLGELLYVRFMIERFWGENGALLLTPDRRDRLLSVEGSEKI